MAFSQDGPGTTPLTTTCTEYDQVSITVPGAGVLVVWSTVTVEIAHTAGTQDVWRFSHSLTTADCTTLGYIHLGEVSASVGTDGSIYSVLPMFTQFAVGTAGTYTIYLNGEMFAGASAGDSYAQSSTLVAFYAS